MDINLNQTLRKIERYLPEDGTTAIGDFHKAYRESLRLQSQLLGVIYDMETFSAAQGKTKLAEMQSTGKNEGSGVILVINEPLPAMKRPTEALEGHWKAMIHAAIAEAARQGPLPYSTWHMSKSR